jgi:hypothetical protein
MPRIILKEKITKEIEIPMDTLFEVIDNLSEEERTQLLERLAKRSVELRIKSNPSWLILPKQIYMKKTS